MAFWNLALVVDVVAASDPTVRARTRAKTKVAAGLNFILNLRLASAFFFHEIRAQIRVFGFDLFLLFPSKSRPRLGGSTNPS